MLALSESAPTAMFCRLAREEALVGEDRLVREGVLAGDAEAPSL
jgi:hypothetical protein